MEKRILTGELLETFRRHLLLEEHEGSTVEKYLRELRQLLAWLAGGAVTKERAAAWKESLVEHGYAPATVNGKLAAMNALFLFAGWEDCRVKSLRLQRRLFREPKRELSREEYGRLLHTAEESGRERLLLLLETICSTGIRVSETRYITLEAAGTGKAEISLKGKVRTILLPGKLCRKLQKYAKRQKIVSGEIFLTRSGKPLSRKQIWSEMKTICAQAGVEPGKVFPHNLRHLFARCFYRACRDVVKLADVLGHSSVETTRIYLISTGEEHARALDRLQLVS